jgi:hypothetical protein
VYLLLAFFKSKKPPVDVSEHIHETTLLVWLAFALLVAFFVIRPELWRRMWFKKGDPRPMALVRIFFGISILWTMVDYLAFKTALFTDEGLYMTEMARSKFGGRLRNLWDAEHGFEHWYDIFDALWAKFSILHMRSDPFFVGCVFALCIATLSLMILGLWTRPMTFISWFLVNNIYNYSPVSYTGGDTALRVFFFLALFMRWGEAYSIDTWRRRRKAILGGASAIPALRQVPLWPTYIVMVQLTCIYFATGLLKSGSTWFDGTALYYAMQLDHFYRFQNTAIPVLGHYLHLTHIGTWVTHYWERLFPLAVLGVMLRGWHIDWKAGMTPKVAWSRRILSWLCIAAIWGVATYFAQLGVHYYFKKGMGNVALTKAQFKIVVIVIMLALPPLLILAYRWIRKSFPQLHDFVLNVLLGKRLWIGLAFVFHAMIDLFMNVGTFVQNMISPFFVWMTGEDIDRMWRFVYWRPAKVGEQVPAGHPDGVRPQRRRWRLLMKLFDRMHYRVRRAPFVVRYGEDEMTIRRVALLRVWDLGQRFDYAIDPNLSAGLMRVEAPDGKALDERAVDRRVLRSCPALWVLLPLAWLPPVARLGRRIIGLPTLAVGSSN